MSHSCYISLAMKGRGRKKTWPASAMMAAASGFQMESNDPAGGGGRN